MKKTVKKSPGHSKGLFRRRWRRPLAVAVHDGTAWTMTILSLSGGQWRAGAPVECDSRNGRQIPRVLLDAAAQSGVRRLRLLLSGDPRIFSIEAHHELFPEELQSALRFEAKGELGADAEDMRFAAALVSQYDMGAGRQDVLTAGFAIESLEQFAANAQRAGLDFESAGALESAILKWHSSRSPEKRLLFVREKTSFYVVPADNAQPFWVTTLPLGLDALHDPVARERAKRAHERLAAHKTLPLCVVIAGNGKKEKCLEIEPLLGGARDIDIISLKDMLSEVVSCAAYVRESGLDSPCGLIGLPPAPRDPHRHGTVIFFFILLMTLGWIVFQRQAYIQKINRAQQSLERWEDLQTQRQTAKTSAGNLRDQLDRQRAGLRLLSKHQPLPRGILTILDAVARHMPEYSRLESIRQIEDGLEITGITRWQEGLSQLDEGLRKAAAAEGLRREFGGLETMEDSGVQRFRFIVRAPEVLP